MPDPLTAADLDRLDALVAAVELAFPLRWGEGRSEVMLEEGILDADGDAVFVNCGRGSGEPTPEEVAYLIHAANATPALVGLVRELAAALAPFGDYGRANDASLVGREVPDVCPMEAWDQPTVGDCRRAAALLARIGGRAP